MNSQVFYRKWRPQTLAEVVGQEHATQTLRNALVMGQVAHAYLFCGPRGTGKTSTARILAKAVNCLNPLEGEPCNACDLCQSISEGRALDVMEIDAASNRGIDEIRELRERVNYAPNLASYKVYILDEVHMLTEAASNALLKTLEEPPSQVIFILATTEPHKVLPTILSRCQRFDFHRLSQAAVISKLELICEREGIRVEPEALRFIARAATGSLRDAENLLEQLAAYYGHQIELYQVKAVLGISSDFRAKEIARHVVKRDIPAGLQTINSVRDDGLDLRQFNQQLVEYLRSLLLVKSGSEEVLDATDEELAEMKDVVAEAALSQLLSAVKRFSEIDLRWDNYSTLPLELALVESALSEGEAKQIVLSEVVEAKVGYVPDSRPKQTVPSEAIEPAESAELSQEAEPPASAEVGDILGVASSQDIDYLRGRWPEFIQALRGEGSRGNLDAFLRSACEPVALEDDTLVLGFYYPFHKEKIEDPKYCHLVQRKLKEIYGHSYHIRCTLISRGKKVEAHSVDSPVVEAALEEGARIIGEGAQLMRNE